jgi:hypothetical protein
LDSDIHDQWREATLNQICTEVAQRLGDQVSEIRTAVHELVSDLPKMIRDALQDFFQRSDTPAAPSRSPVLPGEYQSSNEGRSADDVQDQLETGKQDRLASTAEVVSESSGDDDDASKLAETESSYSQLHEFGKRGRKQLPLRLLLKMYRKGAIAGAGPNGDDDPEKGFLWKDAPYSHQGGMRCHRGMLEERGFILIPHWTAVSEKAKTGEAKRISN